MWGAGPLKTYVQCETGLQRGDGQYLGILLIISEKKWYLNSALETFSCEQFLGKWLCKGSRGGCWGPKSSRTICWAKSLWKIDLMSAGEERTPVPHCKRKLMTARHHKVLQRFYSKTATFCFCNTSWAQKLDHPQNQRPPLAPQHWNKPVPLKTTRRKAIPTFLTS